MAAKTPAVQLRRTAVAFLLAGTALCLPADIGTAAEPVAKSAPCVRPGHGFKPAEARIPAIERRVKVVVVQRTGNNQMGAGPLGAEEKWWMAMDPVTKPGSGRGTVLLSAHNYPDGSALGNALLRKLRSGDRLTLVGRYGEQACYGVYKRVSYPADEVPHEDAFRTGGVERLVIVTCSGTRRGPGDWSHRTLWYAKPVVPKTSSPTPSTPPPSSGDDSSLLGGLLGGLFG